MHVSYFFGYHCIQMLINLTFATQKPCSKPNPLEVHKDTVNFDLSGNLPAKLLKKGTVFTVNPFYKYGDNELALPAIPFKAEDYPANSTSQTPVSKSFSFPYKDAYKVGTVETQYVA